MSYSNLAGYTKKPFNANMELVQKLMQTNKAQENSATSKTRQLESLEPYMPVIRGLENI